MRNFVTPDVDHSHGIKLAASKLGILCTYIALHEVFASSGNSEKIRAPYGIRTHGPP